MTSDPFKIGYNQEFVSEGKLVYRVVEKTYFYVFEQTNLDNFLHLIPRIKI